MGSQPADTGKFSLSRPMPNFGPPMPWHRLHRRAPAPVNDMRLMTMSNLTETNHILLVVLIITLFPGVCSTKKVLMVPSQHVSHVTVAEELLYGSRGHTVHMLLQETFPILDTIRETGITPILHPVGDADILRQQSDSLTKRFLKGQKWNAIKDLVDIITIVKRRCSNILHDNQLMEKLREMPFNLALVDGLHFSECMFVVPYNLSIPYVYMFSVMPDLSYGIPNLPSMAVTIHADFPPATSLWQTVRGGPFDNWGGGGGWGKCTWTFYLFFPIAETIFLIWPEVKNNLFVLYNKIGSNFFFALLTLDPLVVSLKFVCTGYVAEWLVLVTLVRMPQRMGGRLGLGS